MTFMHSSAQLLGLLSSQQPGCPTAQLALTACTASSLLSSPDVDSLKQFWVHLVDLPHLFISLLASHMLTTTINSEKLIERKLIVFLFSYLGVVHKLRWQIFVSFWPSTSICLHLLPYESWHFLTTYPPLLVKVVCERPLIYLFVLFSSQLYYSATKLGF